MSANIDTTLLRPCHRKAMLLPVRFLGQPRMKTVEVTYRMCRPADRYSRCRNSVVGNQRRWCGAMRILPPITWRRMRSASGRYVRSRRIATAQKRRSPKNSKGPHHCKPLNVWLRGQDLNLRPSGYEPDELPDCSTPRQKANYSRLRVAGQRGLCVSRVSAASRDAGWFGVETPSPSSGASPLPKPPAFKPATSVDHVGPGAMVPGRSARRHR